MSYLAKPVAIGYGSYFGFVAVGVVCFVTLVTNEHVLGVALFAADGAADVLGGLGPADTLVQMDDMKVKRTPRLTS